jgi:hypothetical protein
MIPKYIHLFHDGPKPLPDMALSTIEWAKKNGYETKLWRAEHLPDFEQKQWLIDKQQWSCLSDVCRHWAVYNFGGFYMDTDCEIVGDLEPLRKWKWFATKEPPRFVNCAFSGGQLHNRVSALMLEVIVAFNFKGYRGNVPLPAWVGPWLQTQVWDNFCALSSEPGFTIIPTEVGFGLTYQQYHRGVREWPSDCIVRHYWAKSW